MRRLLVAVAAGLVLLPPLTAAGRVSVDPSTATAETQPLLDWNLRAVNTVRTAGKFQAEGEIYMAYVHAAMYDAVTAIEGGYEQYDTDLSAPAGASPQAAAVSAAYQILVYYFPAQSGTLTTAYANSLAALALTQSAQSIADGVAVGQAAAAAIEALRAGDVRSGNDGYTFPPAGPGAWSLPTPDSTATAPQTPWIRSLQPFMILSPSQFRVAPPPDLTSDEYAKDFNEVKDYGGKVGTLRTTEQGNVARFWTANVINQYNLWLRTIAGDQELGPEQAVRLLAMGNMVVADAAIGCWDSKYAYSFWRPVQAIRGAETDGNPATSADPNWTPFLAPTPNHPEYPSAHGCLTAGLANVFADLFGTKKFHLELAGLNPATGLLDPSYTRPFDDVKQLQDELQDARVWAGYHFRNSVKAGEILGMQVANFALAHYFRPTH
jgi:hypothetical protein